MKVLNAFASIYSEWEYINSQYGQDQNDFPWRVILKNCHGHSLAAEVTGLNLHEGRDGPTVTLQTTSGEITINKNCPWHLALGQTNKKRAIFTHHLE